MRFSLKAAAEYYKQIQIETLPQYNRVVFLHETANNLVRQAMMGEEKDVRERLDKAQDILVQLKAMVKEGQDENDIAVGLIFLYDYLYYRLEDSDMDSMKDANQVLTILNETFYKLMKKRE